MRTARKHIGWYTRLLVGGDEFCARMNQLEEPDAQAAAVDEFLQEHGRRFGTLRHVNVVVRQNAERSV